MNMHRWRKLEGSDPELLDLLQRFNLLQKRLILKTEEVVERDLTLAEKEKSLVELKAKLASQPGPELAETLSQTQQLLAERTRQLKAVASEVNMWQSQVEESKYEVTKLKTALAEARKAVLDEKEKGRSRGMAPSTAKKVGTGGSFLELNAMAALSSGKR